MDTGIEIIVGFGVGILVSLTWYNIKLKKLLNELKVTDAQIEDLKRNIESYSKELDNLERSTELNLSEAKDQQAEIEKLISNLDS